MIRFVAVRGSGPQPEGFPVEIAWTDELGRSEHHLIRPAAEWAEAARTVLPRRAVSGAPDCLTLERLLDEGVAPMEVVDRIVPALWSPVVLPCSECPAVDTPILSRLFRADGADRPRVVLYEVHMVYGRACRPLLDLLPPRRHPAWSAETKRLRTVGNRLLARAKKAASKCGGPEGGALAEAEAMRRTWMAVRDGAARLAAGRVAV